MKHLGLFEGIGGFSLAARWAGWETIAWCEIDPFCQKVLSYHFPEADAHEDIKTTDFSIYRGKCDIVTGGFPCQPYSTAGKRLGKADERHLWPEMLRAIREIQPRWVVGENVRGLINWNGGLVFDEVQADLEAIGYEVTAFILPACAVNAPHRRDRVWFVAYAEGYGGNRTPRKSSAEIRRQDAECIEQPAKRSKIWPTPDPQQPGREGADILTGSARLEQGTWDNWPTVEPTIRRGDDGFPYRLDGITFPKWRNESIKAYGNAVVPQVVYQIFQAINQIKI